MPHETATLFFALLAVTLALGLLVLAVLVITRQGSDLVAAVHASSLELAALVAVTCTAGSLYLSEVANFTPCRLCWVQRAFMYPAALLLVGAVITKRRWPAQVAGVLALVGLAVSLFHRYEQAAGELSGLCDAVNPCSARWVEHFGFITIPTMAAVGFVGVSSLVGLHLYWRQP